MCLPTGAAVFKHLVLEHATNVKKIPWIFPKTVVPGGIPSPKVLERGQLKHRDCLNVRFLAYQKKMKQESASN